MFWHDLKYDNVVDRDNDSRKLPKILFLDFDGVLTDGYVYVDENGRETVRCSHRDGMGIKMLIRAGVKVIVVSGQISPYVAARCQKMDIPFFQNVRNKARVIDIVMGAKQWTGDDVVFMGDDLNDIEAMTIPGITAITVADAADEVKSRAHYVTKNKGGEGAVREVCDLILKAKGETQK